MPYRHPKQTTDPPERQPAALGLGRSVHLHNKIPNFRRKPSIIARSRWFVVVQLQVFGLDCRSRGSTLRQIQKRAGGQSSSSRLLSSINLEESVAASTSRPALPA
jgi:hypothetical protein